MLGDLLAVVVLETFMLKFLTKIPVLDLLTRMLALNMSV